jgi:hypothetical protein
MDDPSSDFESIMHLAVWIVGVGAVCAVIYLALYIGLMLRRLAGFERTHRHKGSLRKTDAGLSRFAA